MQTDRRTFIRGLAAFLSPVSPLSDVSVLDVLNTGLSTSVFDNLSMNEIFEAASDFSAFRRPAKVDGKRFFNSESFSRVITNSGIRRVEILRILDSLGLTPAMLREHKDQLLEHLATSDDLSPHADTIAKMLERVPSGVGETYGEIADFIEAYTKNYIKDILKHDGGKALISGGMRLLGQEHLQIFKEKYGDVIPEDLEEGAEKESNPSSDVGNKKTLLITTGGTIESFYNPEEGTPDIVPLEKPSIIPKAMGSISEARKQLASGEITATELAEHCLSNIRADQSRGWPPFDHHAACLLDSKHITKNHLYNIAAYIHEHSEEYDSVIIVHGTDTMPVHGRRLKEMLAEYDAELGEGQPKEKKIIFAGSMEPLRDEEKSWRPESDGWEHLSLALRAANDPATKSGTYFTYEGNLLRADEYDKHREVDEANHTVTESGFVKRIKPHPHEKEAGHIWQ